MEAAAEAQIPKPFFKVTAAVAAAAAAAASMI
jgi:hypothetical protein